MKRNGKAHHRPAPRKSVRFDIAADETEALMMMSAAAPKKSEQAVMAELASDTSKMEDDLVFIETLISQVYPQRIEVLEKLLATIQAKNFAAFFDAQDVEWVREDLESQRRELAEITEIWKHTYSIYSDTYLGLSKTLETRQDILNRINEETDLFAHRPMLIDKFAQKQAEFAEMMDICRDKIRKEQRDIKSRVDFEKKRTDELFALAINACQAGQPTQDIGEVPAKPEKHSGKKSRRSRE